MIIQPFPQSGPDPDDGQFALRLAEVRVPLCGYVAALLPDRAAAEDVVQETCLFLWVNRGNFVEGTSFRAWAFKTAYFKALSCRRDMQRAKEVSLSEELIHRLADAAEHRAEAADERLAALRQCVAALRSEDRTLLQSKYTASLSLTEQARAAGVPPNRLQKAISRIRLALRHCIFTRLASAP